MGLKCKIDNISSDNAAVVFLLGWSGCKDQHLNKYSELYLAKNFVVIRYCTSGRLMLGPSPKKQFKKHAAGLLNLLYEHQIQNLPIFLHVFSNGGAALFYLILQELKKPEHSGLCLFGSIFDSAPALMSNKNKLNAAVTIVPGPLPFKYYIGAHLISFFWIAYPFKKCYGLVRGKHDTEDFRHWIWYTLAKEPNSEPQLFLFSKKDNICDYKSILKFAKMRDELQVKTHIKLFEGSRHVQHLLGQPEEYSEQVHRFIDEILEPNEQIYRF